MAIQDEKFKFFEGIAKSQGFSQEEIEPFREFARIKMMEQEQAPGLGTDIVSQRQIAGEERARAESESMARLEANKFRSVGKDVSKLSSEAFDILAKEGFDFSKLLEAEEEEEEAVKAPEAKLRGMMKSGFSSLNRLENEFRTGKTTKEKWLTTRQLFGATTGKLPIIGDITPWGRGLESDLFNIADTILRLRTGAAAPEKEIIRYVKNKAPGLLDPQDVKEQKLNAIRTELEETISALGLDPKTFGGLPKKPPSLGDNIDDFLNSLDL